MASGWQRGFGVVSRFLVPAALGATATQGCSAAHEAAEDPAVRAARVHVVGQPLSLSRAGEQKSGGIKAQDFAASVSSGYTYVASVDAPTNPTTGHVLQATNFAFGTAHAYVAYNMAGPDVEGALDVIDLSDTTHPQLVGSRLFPAAEFADVALRGVYALLVGTAGGAIEGGVLTVVDVGDPADPKVVTQVALGSHYGTSITLEGTTAFVSTGDDGGIVRVDITNPASPRVLDKVALPNALYTLRADGKTLALGGAEDTRLYSITSGSAPHELAKIGGAHIAAPGRMAFANGYLVTNGAHTGLTVLHPQANYASASVAFHSDLPGTGNGVDVVDNLAILAQGEAGTFLYDLKTPTAPALLGSFAFPDERGSANEVRLGTCSDYDFVFLSDGLNGFRIVKISSSNGNAGAACGVEWWRTTHAGDWWSAPATADDSPGTWTALASETSPLCLVEQFVPTAANAACSAIQVKRAIAVGPQPSEAQVCPVRCPAGTVIANVHSRYGEASPLNDGGSHTCTGTTTPDLREVECDVMSDFCNGTQSSCSITYSNSFCGDPWYGCIKSGRTKWQCVPVATPTH